ncbi:helix-turn-helix transcriptional regulator [Streptomyces brasiliensis]|uniref:LuxR family transcriptional regulator n=1 Tax=Streptomyces brasiliensis TaxID=1954 RepID=A0A917KV12_9ACTN|nr:AAA family ATPase [Streptomyces brasiliensis]GGJ29333.1 LuxR family transcriptional regulator [Streptomyces brasiliensis]
MRRANIDAGRLPALSLPRFVGRDREVAVLGEALGQAPAVVLIDGAAGIGKTRLLREFLVSQGERGRRVLVGSCPELRVPYTLGAVVDAVRDGVGSVSGLGLSGLCGALRPLFPEWAADLPPAPEPLEDATAARHRLFHAFVEVLSRLDVAVLALEDVHWADEATLEFLLFLVSRRLQPVSVVVTYRREEVTPGSLLLRLSSRLPADAHLVRLALKPLGIGETAAIVSSMLADEPVSAEFAAFLHARTEGIPLAVEESVRLMHDRADLIRQGGGWARRRLDRIEVPPTIRDAMLERVGRLHPDAQAVLYAVSVLSGPADYANLNAVTGLSEDRFAAQAADALGCGLLREDGRGHWSFHHALARQAVYEAIPAQERRVLHVRAGRALEDSPLPSVAQLARHFRLAGDAEAACRYTEQAADLSIQTGDVATAALLLYNLVTTLALPVEPLARLVMKIQFHSLLPDSDPHSKIIESLQSALRTRALTLGQQALLRFHIGRVLMMAGAMEAGRHDILRAVPDLAPDSLEAARARTLLALPLGNAQPASEYLRWLGEAPAVAPSLPPHERLRLVQERAFALLMLGEVVGWAEARRIPDDTANPREAATVVVGHTNVGEAAMRWGRIDEAEARLAKAQTLAERHELLSYLDSIASSRAHLDWFTGAWTGLAERAARLIDDEDRVRLKDRCEAALVAGLLQAAAGDRAEAVERLRFAAQDDQQRIEATAALAQLSLRDGDIEQALRLTEEPAEISVGSGIWPRAVEIAPVRVAALVAAGRLGDAADLVTAFERALGGTDAPAPQASLELCRGMLAEADGRLADAARLFAQAADAWQALPRPYDALLARERHARCLLAADRTEGGLLILSEVSRALADLGAHNDAERVAQTLNERGWDTRVARGRGRPGYGNRLSPRELEVARLLVGGRTNRQIAEALGVSTQTVASQLKSAMRKLSATSRTVLALRVVELGLVGEHGQPPAGDE